MDEKLKAVSVMLPTELQALSFRWRRTGGGLFVGVRWYSAFTVHNSRWQLIDRKFQKVPPQKVRHLEIGLLTHTISVYIRKYVRKTK